jgi:cytidine deaminase
MNKPKAMTGNRLERELVRAALDARRRSHCPYSGYAVGSAVLTAGRGGKIFTGCNVENASYGATICAERAALCSAVGAGEKTFRMHAIAVGGREPAPPCGICLQFMAELCDDLPILLVAEGSGKIRRTTLRKLLPERFRFRPGR